MAWTFYCAADNLSLMEDTKEKLADAIVKHMDAVHNEHVDYDQAMDMVNRDATQEAA